MSNVAVCVRFRPVNDKEIKQGGSCCLQSINAESVVFKDEKEGEFPFSFDKVFYDDSTQAEVFQFVALPVVKDAMNAINGTILAYGQTGTGKTHSIEGPHVLVGDPLLKGMLPRVAETIFKFIEEAEESYEFLIKLSIVEIYMERIRDLFDTTKDNLLVKEDKAHGIYVAGATEKYVQTEQEMLQLLEVGIANRAVGTTQMNPGSSRSHCVFLFTITQQHTENHSTRKGKLFVVDLAGSEKVGKTGVEGKLLDEAKTINKSLSSLGNVINALTCGRTTHVPYRDSKLTRILQESLGGNSRTTLLCCCSPSTCNAAETLSTLRFGTRAKQIKNKPVVNAERGRYELEEMLERSESELQQLRVQNLVLNARLRSLSEGNGLENNKCADDGTHQPGRGSNRFVEEISSNHIIGQEEEVYFALREMLAREGMLSCCAINPQSMGLIRTLEGCISEIQNLLLPDLLKSFAGHSESHLLGKPQAQRDETRTILDLIQNALEEVLDYRHTVLEENENLKTELTACQRLLHDLRWHEKYRCPSPDVALKQNQKPRVIRPLRGTTCAVSSDKEVSTCCEESKWSFTMILEDYRRRLTWLVQNYWCKWWCRC